MARSKPPDRAIGCGTLHAAHEGGGLRDVFLGDPEHPPVGLLDGALPALLLDHRFRRRSVRFVLGAPVVLGEQSPLRPAEVGPERPKVGVDPDLGLRHRQPCAESPGESSARSVLLRAGLPVPQTQVRVDTPLGTFWSDLGWPEWRLLAEYDGRA